MLASSTVTHQKVDTVVRSGQKIPEAFVFVPITGKEAAKGRGAAKRIVRAHVTRVQHAKSNTFNSHNLESWTVRPYIHRDSASAKRKPKGIGPATRRRADETEKAEETTKEVSKITVLSVPKCFSDVRDPFWTYPVDYQPQLSPIFAHYVQNVAVDIPDLDGPNARGLLRRYWFPLAMTEAATMYAVLLMAASHFVAINPGEGARIDLLALKARALSEINTALADPKRACTDAIIGAIAKMAAYEASFGDSEVYAAHMKGLQLVLKMRGGLASLGLDGLLERMVVWIDTNAAHLTGRKTLCGTDELPTTIKFVPDPFHFAGIQ